jgi:hypothetical protein
MPKFQPGDEVICVDDRRVIFGHDSAKPVKAGERYTVNELISLGSLITLVGMGDEVWGVYRFEHATGL